MDEALPAEVQVGISILHRLVASKGRVTESPCMVVVSVCQKVDAEKAFFSHGVKVYKTPEQREEYTQSSIRVSKSKS